MDTSLLDVSTIEFGPPSKLGNTQLMVIPLSTVSGRFDWATRLSLQFGKDQEHMLTTSYGVSQPQQGGDPDRRNLDIIPDEALTKTLQEVDKKVVEYMSSNCEELFKTKMLLKQHCPILKDKTTEGGGMSLRVKVITPPDAKAMVSTLPGLAPKQSKPTEVRSFNEEKTKVRKVDYTSIGRDAELIVVADTPGVWYNASQFGVSFTARSILCKPTVTKNGLGMFNLLPGVVEDDEKFTDGVDDA